MVPYWAWTWVKERTMALPQSGAHSDGGFVTEGQDDKEDTSNLLDSLLDNELNQPTTFDVTAGGTFNLNTPSANLDQFIESSLIRIIGSPASATTVILPDGNKKIAFANSSGKDVTFDTVSGATPTVTIVDGVAKTLHVRGIEITITADDATQTGALLADGSVPATGAFDWVDNQIIKAELKDYSETSTSPSSAGGTLTLDLENGNDFDVTLTESTVFTFSNPPVTGKAGSFTLLLSQDGTGGWVTTWPAAVIWPGGGSPDPTVTLGATDLFSFFTVDAGTTWFGFVGGLDFS